MSDLFTPKEYQSPLIDKLKSNDCYGLFSFPGSGKTAMILDMVYKYREPTLVVCPLAILYTTWLTEHTKWSQFKTLKIRVLHGKDRNKNFFEKSGVYLINPEGIPWLINKIRQTKRFPFKNLVIDESIRFKNPKSKRFTLLKKHLNLFSRRFVMCGNPIPNGYIDLWSQIYILDLGKRLKPSFYQFRKNYFYPTDYKRFIWELKPDSKEKILQKISDICSFLAPEDTDIELPDRMEDTVIYDLSEKDRNLYREMESKLFISLTDTENEDGKVLATTRASALNKCRQIAQGFVYENTVEVVNGQEKKSVKIHNLNSTLIDLCKEQVEELAGQPVVIVYWYNQDYDNLVGAFSDYEGALIVPRGCKSSYIRQVEQKWNDNEISVLICHISTVSHGLNLQYGKGNRIFLYALTYNYDTYDQLIRRLQRQGAKYKTVFIKRFMCKNSIHEAMISSLNKKKSEMKGFFSGLREVLRKRHRK